MFDSRHPTAPYFRVPDSERSSGTFEADDQVPVGEFLEAVGYHGSVTRELVVRVTPLVEAAGRPGMARWRLAVRMAREAVDAGGRLPTAEELLMRWRAGAVKPASRRTPPDGASPQAAERSESETSGPESITGPVAPSPRVQMFIEALGAEEVAPEMASRYGGLISGISSDDVDLWETAVSMTAMAPGREPPTPRDLAAEHARRQEEKRRRAEEDVVRIRALAVQVSDAARAFIAQAWERTGTGPTWREVTRHIGVSARDTEPLIEELHRIGVVVSSDEPRSLRTGPAPTPAELTGPVVPLDGDVCDAPHLLRVIAAREGIAAAEAELRASVAAARASGASWAEISTVLDTTEEAARVRFSR